MELNSIVRKVHHHALEKGWWNKGVNMPSLLCFVHEEVSSALSAYKSRKKNKFKEELADIVIRVFSICARRKIDIETEILKRIGDKHA